MTVTRELPRYQACARLQALKIKHIIPNPRGFELHFEDERFAPHEVGAAWCRINQPSAGGYFAVHPDGVEFYLSAEAFEAGYSRIPAPDPSSPPVLVNVDQLLSDLDPETERQAMQLAESFLAMAKAVGPTGITALCLAVGICAEADKAQF